MTKPKKKTAKKKAQTTKKTSAPKKARATKKASPKKSTARSVAKTKPKAKSSAKKQKVGAAPKTTKAKRTTTKKSATAGKTPVKKATTGRRAKLTKQQLERIRKLLLDLRDHLIDGVNSLASEHLKRSQRDMSGELSGYSMHMADAGTDNFDREFALSLVSSEQEALYEIDDALSRLEQDAYGVCEMCEKSIVIERLEAVPFTRLCVICQSSVEKDRRGRFARTGPTFTESAEEISRDSDDSED